MCNHTGRTGGATRSDRQTANRALSLYHVMPREMYFGPSQATSIDLCVRDIVTASRYCSSTKIFAERIDCCFSGFDIDYFPPARMGLTYSRAGYVTKKARLERPDSIIVQQHLPTAAA